MVFASMLRFVLLLSLTTLLGFGQSAEISGLVMDPSNAPIAGAMVTVTNTEKQISRQIMSNESGRYTVANLVPGLYQVAVQAAGFQPSTRSGFRIDINQSLKLDFALKVGELQQSVEVTGGVPVIETTTGQLGTVITSEKISELPLNARNFTQLLTLTPGASPVSVTQGDQNQRIGITVQPAMNGQSNRSNSYTLDGVYNNGHFTSSYAVAPSVEALDQFKVQSHSDLAEFGGVTGGVINIASKTGTNQIHGTLFEFLRNDKLDARGFFTAGKPALRQNQFGASVGGPLIKNKTFYFFSYEGYQQKSGANILSLVPTQAQIGGDFSGLSRRLFDPYSTRTNPANPLQFLRDPYPNNRIPSAQLNRSILALTQAIVPAPIDTGVSGFNARNGDPQSFPANNYSIRVDHYLSEKDNLWFRATWSKQDISAGQALAGTNTVTSISPRNIGAQYSHSFSPNTLFTGLFGFSSSTLVDRPFFTNKNLIADGFFKGFPLDPRSNAPGVTIPGYFSTSMRDRRLGPQRGWQVKGDLSHNVGRHTIKFGAEVVRQPWENYQLTQALTFNTRQSADLNALGNTGDALASYMLGLMESVTTSDVGFGLESQIWNGYIQDTWRVSSKLTLNVGLRYDLVRMPNFYTDFQSTWDFNTGKYLVGRSKPGACSSNRPPCLQNPNDPYLQQWVVFTGSSQLRKNDFKMFGPRFGFAYQANPRTVLRGTFGIFYDTMAGVNQQAQNGAIGNANWPGNRGATLIQNTNQIEANADAPFGTKDPLSPDPTPARLNAFYYDPNFQNPYSQQWNLEIQRELMPNLTLSTAYVGSHTLRLSIGGDYNTALTPGPGPDRPRALWPHAPVTGYDRSVGQSGYHGLLVKAERRFARGLSYLVSYTWSKSIDVASSAQFRESMSLQNPYNPNESRSVSGFHVPHMFSTAAVYELPFGRGRRWATDGVASRVLGNWQMNAIVQARSGQPYTLFMNVDVANIGAINQAVRARPNLVGNPKLDNPTPEVWFNRSAFASPPAFSFGTAGRNILSTDNLTNFDLSLFREDRIREGMRLQFRAELFNSFNHPTFGVPNSLFTSPQFGRVTSTVSTARQIQLGLKLIF
jgi:hypothetical protein